jgi:hypothetical protein
LNEEQQSAIALREHSVRGTRSQCMRLFSSLILGLFALFAIAACDEEPTAETPTATPTATSAATVAPTPAATATPVAVPPVVTDVIDAVNADDVPGFMALVQTVSTPCTRQPGAGGPPKCWSQGISPSDPAVPPEGTVVDVFPLASCELGWYSRDGVEQIVEATLPSVGDLYAVLRLTRPLFSEQAVDFPEAEYAAVFVRRASGMPESAFIVATDQSGVTFIDLPCGQSAREALANPLYRGQEVVQRGPAFQQ